MYKNKFTALLILLSVLSGVLAFCCMMCLRGRDVCMGDDILYLLCALVALAVFLLSVISAVLFRQVLRHLEEDATYLTRRLAEIEKKLDDN